jgi:protein gp37
MGENSKIEWCTHTFNPWVGCTKVSPACDLCYAETWSRRTGQPELWKGARRRTTSANWNEPRKWNAAAAKLGIRAKVFCASLADVWDNQVPAEWRRDLFDLIHETPQLDWLLLTKRPQNIEKMLLPATGEAELWPWPNVWLGTTVENQEEAERRIPKLLAVPARVHFLSCEPLLGPLDLTRVAHYYPATRDFTDSWTGLDNALTGFRATKAGGWHGSKIGWVIAGGESGGKARPMHPDWARDLRDQCAAAGVPFLFKQWGEWAPGECADFPATRTERVASLFDNNWDFGTLTPRESAETHREDAPDVYWLGKKRAGRLLDGVEHNGMPA